MSVARRLMSSSCRYSCKQCIGACIAAEAIHIAEPEHGLSAGPAETTPFGTGFGRAVGSGVLSPTTVVARNYDGMMTGLQRRDVARGDLGEREVVGGARCSEKTGRAAVP